MSNVSPNYTRIVYSDSFNYELFETCESYLIRKMMKTPFIGKDERASDLIEIICIEVCEPMSIHAREGFSYFITFMDEQSRYGYV